MRSLFEDQLLIFLSHAAHDADDQVLAVSLLKFDASELAVNLVFGVFTDAARVEQNRVGSLDVVGKFELLLAQSRDNQLAVQHVHLAANGLDVELFVVRRLGHGTLLGVVSFAGR